MKTRSITLADSGKDVEIKELLHGKAYRIGQQCREYKAGDGWVVDEYKMQRLILEASVNLKAVELDELTVSDVDQILEGIRSLTDKKEIQGKSQEQSPQEGPKT